MKYCPKCGNQNTKVLSDVEWQPFTPENNPSIPRGDALYAGIDTSITPLFIPCLCFDCSTLFAIFGLPTEVHNTPE